MMKQIINKVLRFMTSNTAWIFGVLLLFFTFLLMMSVLKNSWTNYLTVFVKLCLIYSPVLLFAFFREQLLEKLNKTIFTLIWVFVFIVSTLFIYVVRVPLIQFLISNDQYSIQTLDVKGEFTIGFFLTVSGCILATEIALMLSRYIGQNFSKIKWYEKLGIDKLIAGIFFILAFILSASGVVRLVQQETMNVFTVFGSFVGFLFQYLLILSVYFFYYYINKHILIPKLLKEKGFIYYGFSVAGVILVFYPIFVFLIRLLPIVEDLNLNNYITNNNIFANDGGSGVFFVMLLTVPIIISNQWYQQNSKISNLEKEKSATELGLLKQQINPHFFFNTLNNLYALSITKDKQTPEVILQLSELMRYVIYKGKEDLVPLHEEIKYIEDYIQLQQIRLHKNLDLKFEKNIADKNVMIPPLLFITFVENAFKHGIEPAENACFLHLDLKSDADNLTFSCINSLEEKPTNPTGIGIENLRRRMELRFPNRHQIASKENENDFKAILIIKHTI